MISTLHTPTPTKTHEHKLGKHTFRSAVFEVLPLFVRAAKVVKIAESEPFHLERLPG